MKMPVISGNLLISVDNFVDSVHNCEFFMHIIYVKILSKFLHYVKNTKEKYRFYDYEQ